MATRRINKKNLFFVIFIVIILIAVICFAVKLIFFTDYTVKTVTQVKKDGTKVTDTVSQTKETNLIDYQVFKDENNELGFDFVVARFKFSDVDKINHSLSEFETSEGIKLDKVSEYTKKLEDKEYYLSSLDVVKEIKSDTSPYTCNIFIPVTEATDTLTITFDNKNYDIDLTNNNYSINSLKYTSGSDIKTTDYDFHITNAYLSDSLKLNGEDYSPSAVQFYTYELKINDIADGLKIEDAEFIPKNSSVTNKAKDENYSSMKCENIINKELKKDSKACLFFEVVSPDEETKVTYEGTLRLKLSNGNWISMTSEFK